MGENEKEFMKKLSATFRVEAEEHLKALSSALIELEKTGPPEALSGIIEAAFRESHSLKGAAHAVNMPEVEAAARCIENVFAGLKRGEIELCGALFDRLHQAVDGMDRYIVSADGGEAGACAAAIGDIIKGFEDVSGAAPAPDSDKGPRPEDEAASAARPPAAQSAAQDETLRIQASRLGSLFLQTEQLLPSRLAVEHQVQELGEIHGAIVEWIKKGARRGLVPEGLDAANLKTLERRVASLLRTSEQNARGLAGVANNLIEDMKRVLMLPFSSVLEAFPKMARDIAREQGKEVNFEVAGGEVEIDKRILDEMKDPLMHLVRNCIDHGIETPELREQKGKPRRGRITISITQKDSGKVEILADDDGEGVSAERILAAARKAGVVPAEDAGRMTEPEVLPLAFCSGVTTSPIITDISGRGLGLAIVRGKVEKLGGRVSFETSKDAGTTFNITLPVSLATFKGVLVRLGGSLFMFPATHVEQVVRIRREDIETVKGVETIGFESAVVPLARLNDALELPMNNNGSKNPDKVYAVVVRSAGKRAAFVVDEFINEQEVLVKGLGRQLSRVRNIAGAAVLGTGGIVPVLNADDLVKAASKTKTAAAPVRDAAPAAGPKSVLVVEDSITSRTLLRNIIETAGYDVKTAVDGMDALTQLRSGEFDIVVSDVDMPRMNGFDLTVKVRSDGRLSETPVVLVTALDSREDRERGIEAGANAYIVKSSFDQSNLLETIGRLV